MRLLLQKSDRAPSVDRTVLRSPRRADSGQVLPRHTRGSPYRCSLPGLAGFDDSRCVGPNLQRRPTRLIQHGTALGRGFDPAEADCGLQGTANSPSSTATSNRWRRGRDLNPRHRGYPCTAFPVPHLRPLGHPSCDGSAENWRRGEDLNPRGTFWAPIRFRVGRLQPGSATPPRVIHRRRLSKNARSNAAHSPASTPPTASTRWLSRASSSKRYSDVTAPAFGSGAPNTTRASRAFNTAPQHIAHGSTVT